MRDRAITAFRLLCAARRWPAASRGEFVRKFAAGRSGLEAEVSALLAADAPETGFLAPPMPRPAGGLPSSSMGLTTLGMAGALERPRALPSPGAPPGVPARPGDAPTDWVGRRLLSRFLLKGVIARGGAGTVYAADDEVARCPVAVKVLHRPIEGRASRLALVRREVACLRLLRLPGIVQLHDDGIEDDRYVLAMDLVEGLPFPGVVGVVPWRRIAHPTLALVETLARVHAVGVIHGDLKPLNVLVGPDGLPVVLDLGVSGGPAIDVARERTGPIGATVRYMSPEHARGDPVGPAADLYAIGLMVYEALSGRRPHDAQEVGDLYEQRRTVRPPPLRSVAPTVEPEVAAWVDALLDGDPGARTARSAAALAHVPGFVELPARVAALRERSPGAPVAREDLEALFTGPRRIHHLPEDAAQALLARTDATPASVIAELVAWVRAGLARWDGEGVAIDRPALERLRLGQSALRSAPGSPGSASGGASQGAAARLYQLIAAGQLDLVTTEAGSLGDAEAEIGRSEAAQQLLGEGIRAAQALGQREQAERLLIRAVDTALDQGTSSAFDRLLYRVALVGDPSTRLRRIEGILRAALALNRGEAVRAEELLSQCGAESDADAWVVRCALRVHARCGDGRPLPEHERILSEVARVVARHPGDTSLFELEAWTGWLRYRQLRYADSAGHYRAAASSAARVIRRASHLSQASGAALELFDLEGAERDAGEALRALSDARHPLLEAHATRILRSCPYRRGVPLAPDVELVRATVGLPPLLRAGLACTEAAFAWRAGDRALAVTLLAPALTAELGRAHPQVHAHVGSFLFALGELPAGASVEGLVRAAIDSHFPGLLLQSLGCIGLRAPELVRPHHALLVEQARRFPREEWPRRREVLSISESLAYAGVP